MVYSISKLLYLEHTELCDVVLFGSQEKIRKKSELTSLNHFPITALIGTFAYQ
jgi:hypothetical protein